MHFHPFVGQAGLELLFELNCFYNPESRYA